MIRLLAAAVCVVLALGAAALLSAHGHIPSDGATRDIEGLRRAFTLLPLVLALLLVTGVFVARR
jgi:hypothetical protein